MAERRRRNSCAGGGLQGGGHHPPRLFFYPSTRVDRHPTHHPLLFSSEPAAAFPPTSVLDVFYPLERTAIHAAKCTAIWTSKLPPTPSCHPLVPTYLPRCIHRSRWRLLLPGMTLFAWRIGVAAINQPPSFHLPSFRPSTHPAASTLPTFQLAGKRNASPPRGETRAVSLSPSLSFCLYLRSLRDSYFIPAARAAKKRETDAGTWSN